MIQKTRNYSMFKFIEGNREKVEEAHVQKLIKSIETRNLLEFRPIQVNSKFEIIDGQNRLRAAEKLGVEIYYEMSDVLEMEDIIRLNSVNKNWGIGDYMHYWVTKASPEYVKLREFCRKHSIDLKLALAMITFRQRNASMDFREGRFKFPEDQMETELDLVNETTEYIARVTGAKSKQYLKSIKVWNALIKIFKSANFEREKFFSNLEKLIMRVGIRATQKEYEHLFLEIHNYGRGAKIRFDEENFDE